jgi:hypothetical protein
MSYRLEKIKNKAWRGTLHVRTQRILMRFLTILNCSYAKVTIRYKLHVITGCILPQNEYTEMGGILLHAFRLLTPEHQLLFLIQ